MEILFLVVLILLNGIFAMSEIALVTARRARLSRLAEDGDGSAAVALKLHDEPTRFLLYEAYASAEDAAAHKETAHYLAWRAAVAGMMAEPRRGEPMNGLFPA